jgi:D-serine dehydratase
MTGHRTIGDKTVEQWKKEISLLEEAAGLREVFWINPKRRSAGEGLKNCGLNPVSMDDAATRLSRFAPFIASVFPETARAGGFIESPLREVPGIFNFLKKSISGRAFEIPGRLLVKCDNQLPVSGSIKARGGIYEVLCYAEKLATEKGLLKKTDSYEVFGGDKFRNFFSTRDLAVGSTGNLGLAVGIMGAKLGFRTTVHVSADAWQWKKDLLRAKGVIVVEYDADYSTAVAEGRRKAGPDCYFVDDENSRDLFFGYSVAALRLKKQLGEMAIPVNEAHPLYVYLPCGVGGGPGGIVYGLKRIYGDAVHCFFVEPTHAPGMLLGLITGRHNKISVENFGIDNKTCADGLAMGRPSGFVGKVMDYLLNGEYTISDEQLYRLVYHLANEENLWLEPAAVAGFMGPVNLMITDAGKDYTRRHPGFERVTHLVWATGGNMIPPDEIRKYYRRGEEIALGG